MKKILFLTLFLPLFLHAQFGSYPTFPNISIPAPGPPASSIPMGFGNPSIPYYGGNLFYTQDGTNDQAIKKMELTSCADTIYWISRDTLYYSVNYKVGSMTDSNIKALYEANKVILPKFDAWDISVNLRENYDVSREVKKELKEAGIPKGGEMKVVLTVSSTGKTANITNVNIVKGLGPLTDHKMIRAFQKIPIKSSDTTSTTKVNSFLYDLTIDFNKHTFQFNN